MKLGTIEEEAALCRKAFEGVEVGAAVIHCHHEPPCVEILAKPAEKRITFILAHKREPEQALRLHLFRPIMLSAKERLEYDRAGAEYKRAWDECRRAWAEYDRAGAEYKRAGAEYKRAWDEYERAWDEYDRIVAPLHDKYCPAGKDCPWDGKTIFGLLSGGKK